MSPIKSAGIVKSFASALFAGAIFVAGAQAVTAPAFAQETAAPQAQGTVDVEALMREGALPDVVIGDPDAPVTIVEYASLTCSHCAAFHENTYPKIKEDYLDKGIAKLIIREFPFDPRATAGFMLARCVPEDRRTAMVDVLFDQQQRWAMAQNASVELLAIARQAGMSQEQFTACLQDRDLLAKVEAVQKRGQDEFAVNATPTFFVNGNRYGGALNVEEMSAVIEANR
ncbi:DsbA family protein [Aureimonas fodinaquatilis]|nr:DsbA family protein [Aureimonas fodinaquatilis]